MITKNNKVNDDNKINDISHSAIIVEEDDKLSTGMIIRNIIFAVLAFGIIIFFSVKYTPKMLELLSSTEKLRTFLLEYGNLGIMVFLGIQAAHILIPVIPGEVVQIGGGYVYGTILGSVLLYIGMLAGTIVVFYLSRIFGYPLVKIFVSKKKIRQFEKLSRSKKTEIILFILFFMPGVPKDTLLYATGLMPVKPRRIIIMSTIARMPGVIGSAYIGANLMNKNYTAAIIVSVIAVLTFILGAIFRKKLFEIVNNF